MVKINSLMKYLNRFNENKEEYTDVEKIQLLCLDNLSYLIDDGMIFRVYKEDTTTGISIFLEKENGVGMIWNDINSDFIPFLHILSNTYNIHKDKVRFLTYLPNSRGIRNDFNVNDILDDSIVIKETFISKIIIVLDKKAK
jgi:hypothetical protein